MSLQEIEQNLSNIAQQYDNYPPVMDWHPTVEGTIDIRIDREGHWYHEGTKFERDALVQLFAKLLRCEGDNHYLVTPVEKLAIKVECAPIVILSVVKIGDAENAELFFTTNTNEQVHLASPLAFGTIAYAGQLLPCLPMRNNLKALIHRNVFYQLIAMADIDEDEHAYLTSHGETFYLPSP
ncbi:MAG TPA: DUF1285 domain-containing protein [Pseudomonadales bacterium]|nr:DUF1285 domain-containing protein [Pseudomonadales bacterium]